MAWNEFRTVGAPHDSRPESGGVIIRGLPVFAIVKDNIDPTRSGRLRVYISDLSGPNPDDSQSWIPVSYMTPFYGLTRPSSGNTTYGNSETNSNSYGFWTSPPDIGTTVICIFVNGDVNFGYWIGCVPEPTALHMVPAIGASEDFIANNEEAKTYGGATRLPVTNVNNNNSDISNTPRYLNDAKPVHSYIAAIYSNQGLIRDPIRGPIGSNSQRESPSRVTGISTPGRPIYEGGFDDQTVADAVGNPEQQSALKVVARRGGHSFVMDDGDLIGRDQLMRLRTALGHQILMSDDGQCISIVHSNGKSWVELGKEGTVDVYSVNSVNVRTQGDLNLHADNNININSKKNLNIAAENIVVNSGVDFTLRNGGKFKLHSVGEYTHKVDGSMSFHSKGEIGFKSDSKTNIEGKRINLNSGSASLVPQPITPIKPGLHIDTIYDQDIGFMAAPGHLPSIVSRAPAHLPWDLLGVGADVPQVQLNSSSVLPVQPSPTLQSVNNSVDSVPTNPTQSSIIATASQITGNTSKVSKSIDVNATNSLLAATATNSGSNNDTKNATKIGAGIVNVDGNKQVSIGSYGMNAETLANTGVLKPGSHVMVNKLIQSGKTIDQAMPPSVFTNSNGVKSLSDIANNKNVQTTTMVKSLRQSQTMITKTGAINGKESSNVISGIVLAGATAGIRSTMGVLQSGATSAINKEIGKITRNISNPIARSIVGGVTRAVGSSINQGIRSIGTITTNTIIGSIKDKISSGMGSVKNAISTGNFSALIPTNPLQNTVSMQFTGPPYPYDDDGNLNYGWKINPDTGEPYKSVEGYSPVPNNKGSVAAAVTTIKNNLPKITPNVPQNGRELVNQAINSAQGKPPQDDFLSKVTKAAQNSVNSAVKGAAYGVVNGITNQAINTVTKSIRSSVGSSKGIGGQIARATTGAIAGAVGSSTRQVVNSTVGKYIKDINLFPNSSSGSNYITGGNNALTPVTNNSVNKLTSSIGGITQNAVNNATKNIIKSSTGILVNSTTSAIGSAVNKEIGNISKNITKSIGGVIGKALGAGVNSALRGITNSTLREVKGLVTNKISSVILNGIAPEQSNKINALISNSTNGAAIIPKAATGTSDINSNLNKKFKNLAGKRAPVPNLDGNPATVGNNGTSDKYIKVLEWSKEVAKLRNDLAKQTIRTNDARNNVIVANHELSPGDPKIQQLKEIVNSEVELENQIRTQLTELENSPPS